MFEKLKELFKKDSIENVSVFTLNIEGMNCNSCVNKISKELNSVRVISKYSVFLDKKLVVIEIKDENKIDEVINVINNLGYKVKLLN
ncbi:heavy metal-associated domain-containing protein [Pigmentibacter sp. JX0631]|uniref:heavy-metal-associated domain-containing protein n=1 Tax=Pigmentibacter sp. JX0631 TaxID=2976982 RepID=UPI0024695219|nr:heavy metal-associated domain-containing protein [Pigmentibacter sp. JX0631]WGL60977.1 heavy metal-associated domain-containing protein [Pigmentibacter sp. JX0631]